METKLRLSCLHEYSWLLNIFSWPRKFKMIKWESISSFKDGKFSVDIRETALVVHWTSFLHSFTTPTPRTTPRLHPGKQSFAPDSASVTQTVPEVSALYLLCVHCGLGDETGPSPGRGPSLTHSNKSHPHQLCLCKCVNSKNSWETLHISQDARPNADISSIPHTWPSD